MLYVALKKSGTLSLMTKMDNSYDTYLTRIFEESGKELSGGEWQKIALARCLFRRNGIIVLDEPSSSLDARSEAELFSNIIDECRKNKSD